MHNQVVFFSSVEFLLLAHQKKKICSAKKSARGDSHQETKISENLGEWCKERLQKNAAGCRSYCVRGEKNQDPFVSRFGSPQIPTCLHYLGRNEGYEAWVG